MTGLENMMDLHAAPEKLDRQLLAECIRACNESAALATACAHACLSEEGVSALRDCIRTDLDCADVCQAAARVLSRPADGKWGLVAATVEVCRLYCAACATECENHAEMHEHCRLCAEACRHCEEMCARVLRAI